LDAFRVEREVRERAPVRRSQRGITEIDAAAEHVEMLDEERRRLRRVGGVRAHARCEREREYAARRPVDEDVRPLHVDPPEDRVHGVRARLSNREPHLLEREDVLRALGIG
jgi:hypothetical protein